MATYFVAPHEGIRIWGTEAAKLGRLPFSIDHMVEQLDTSQLKKGDVVIGTLQIKLVADLAERGIDFWALDLDLPPDARGRKLSAVELYQLHKQRGVRFTRYKVRRKESREVEGQPSEVRPAQPAISLIPVSDQLAPAAIGWLQQPTPQVALLASPGMKARAEILRDWLRSREQPPEVAIFDWDDRDYASLLANAEAWAGELAREDRPAVVVHLTGGTKPMSMALQRAFGKRSESFSALSGPYVDTTHRRIEDLLAQGSNPTQTPMRSVLNIRDQLALHGLEIVQATSASPGYGKWMKRRELFDFLRSERAGQWLHRWNGAMALANRRADSRNKKNKFLDDPNFCCDFWRVDKSNLLNFKITWKGKADDKSWSALVADLSGDFGRLLKSCCNIKPVVARDRNNFKIEMSPRDRHELHFLSGVWLECWLASLFRSADVDDWVQGLEISQDGVKNELDLVIANGNRLLLVEVKSGRLNVKGKEDSKGAEALYKLDSIGEKLGRYFSKRWLVSLTELKKPDRDRAQRYGIEVFEGGDEDAMRQAIARWVGATRIERGDSFKPTFALADAAAASAR